MPDLPVTAPPWPHLERELVAVGGVTVTCGQARAALLTLAGSRTSAIAPVLRAAGSPLASCDYFAVARPYLALARAMPKTGRAGAAGRHVTKVAFALAVDAALGRVLAVRVDAAMACIRADERYAAQIAADAVEVHRREHATSVKARVEGEVAAAVTACAATGAACALAVACGTGSCRFASPWLAAYDAPASPGRFRRPGGHHSPGHGNPAGFSPAPVIAAVLADLPYRPQVTVADYETCVVTEEAA